MTYITKEQAIATILEKGEKQGWKRSIDSMQGNACMYNSPDGCQCFIGMLIPEGRSTDDLEGRTVNSARVLNAANIHPSDRVFFRVLQSMHDSFTVDDKFSVFGYTLKEQVIGYAKMQGIEVPAQ